MKSKPPTKQKQVSALRTMYQDQYEAYMKGNPKRPIDYRRLLALQKVMRSL